MLLCLYIYLPVLYYLYHLFNEITTHCEKVMLNNIVKKYFGIGIALAIVAALLFPYSAVKLHPLAVLFLFCLMVVTGITIDWPRMKIILKKPIAILFGNCIIYLIVPVIVFLLSKILLTTDQYIYGAVFAALTPAAIVAPFFTRLFKGNTELSFGILVSSMILSPLLIPIMLKLLLGDTVTMPTMLLAKDMLLLIPLPLLLGFSIKTFFAKISKIVYDNSPILNFVFLSLLIFILFGVSLQKVNLGYGGYSELGWLLLIFFVQDFGLILGARFVFWPRMPSADRTAIILSASMKNIAIAAGILLIYDPRAAIAPGIAFIVHAFLFTPWILKKLLK